MVRPLECGGISQLVPILASPRENRRLVKQTLEFTLLGWTDERITEEHVLKFGRTTHLRLYMTREYQLAGQRSPAVL